MNRYKCTVAYEGSGYCGWQTQNNGRSVQEQIEAALFSFMREPIRIIGAGRTDAGVNAQGQVFQFDTQKTMSAYKMMGAINSFLPSDIHIRRVELVDELFHVRYCVRSKRYDYRIHIGAYDVFSRNTAWQFPRPLDINAMKTAAAYLTGTHDFTSFNANSLSETPDQVRTIKSIDIVQEGDMVTLSFRGRGFLRYMVRMLTAQLVEVGDGRMKAEAIKKILDARSKTAAARNAPAQGLTLMEVDHYKTLALTGHYVIREYLIEDIPVDGFSLKEAEQAVREETFPQYFVLADRHSDKNYGSLKAEDDRCTLTIAEPVDQTELDQLKKQLENRGFCLK